jgi:3-deoxy-7-phosphoheptulonate synthase
VKAEDTVVAIGGVRVGGDELVVVAGPCAIESLEKALTVAHAVRAAGAHLLRRGAFKPATLDLYPVEGGDQPRQPVRKVDV